MDKKAVISKFGANYRANKLLYKMGIDYRFADHIAKRFIDRIVLETCTGGGFTTIALAKKAKHVFTIDIDAERLKDAQYNVSLAGLAGKVTFICNDIFKVDIKSLPQTIDSSFIDPDWADTDQKHVYRFAKSTTRPPSDSVLDFILRYTSNVTLVQPPFIKEEEFCNLEKHELEKLYLAGNHELYCIHFGELAETVGNSQFMI